MVKKKIPAKPPKSLLDEEESLMYEADDSELPPSDIVAFNELRSCADLMRMYNSNQLTIQPAFQRDIVWSNPAQTRFIDSLVKELPIPSMCISFDYNTKERLVIDGLQRMASIIKFLREEQWKLSTLEDVDSKISGLTNKYIRAEHKSVYDGIENLTIPITVLRCDYRKPTHMRYLFTIFHRLNTGGSKLSNQEIRNCIFSGKLNILLKECVNDVLFRSLLRLHPTKSYRYAYEELILRFFAFTDNYLNYDGKLSSYLNNYMNRHRDAATSFINKKRNQFLETIQILDEKIMDNEPLPRYSKATLEAILVGIGRNLKILKNTKASTLRRRLEKLLLAEEFKPENLKNALTTKDKMIQRLRKSEQIIGGK